MDEPSMGLSPALVQQNFEIIKDVHKAGVAILMVEQNANMALSIADRGYVLSTGEIVLSGPASELLGHDELKRRLPGHRESGGIRALMAGLDRAGTLRARRRRSAGAVAVSGS